MLRSVTHSVTTTETESKITYLSIL